MLMEKDETKSGSVGFDNSFVDSPKASIFSSLMTAIFSLPTLLQHYLFNCLIAASTACSESSTDWPAMFGVCKLFKDTVVETEDIEQQIIK